MKVEEIINQLKEVKLGCTISGGLHLGKILMLDLQTDKVLLKLESKIKSTESIIVPNLFANSEDDEEEEKDFSKSPGAKFVRWLFPRVTPEFHGDKFFVTQEEKIEELEVGEPFALKRNEKIVIKTENGREKWVVVKLLRFATPLLIVAGVIEFTDLVFAVDSIPAIFAIAPRDPFILYSSNIFAILGLRSLYFLLANFIGMFRYLKYGLAVILSFIGVKMLIAPIVHISSPLSLGIVVGVLILSTLASLVIKPKEDA